MTEMPIKVLEKEVRDDIRRKKIQETKQNLRELIDEIDRHKARLEKLENALAMIIDKNVDDIEWKDTGLYPMLKR